MDRRKEGGHSCVSLMRLRLIDRLRQTEIDRQMDRQTDRPGWWRHKTGSVMTEMLVKHQPKHFYVFFSNFLFEEGGWGEMTHSHYFQRDRRRNPSNSLLRTKQSFSVLKLNKVR